VRVRKLIERGELGQVQFANAMFNSNILGLLQGQDAFMRPAGHGPRDAYADPARSVGGHGHTQLTHIAGLLFFLTQLAPRRVQAFVQNFGLPVELAAVINVAFDNHAVGTVNGIGSLGGTNHADQDLVIYCTQGIVKLSVRDYTCTVYRPNQEPEILDAPKGDPYPSAAPSQNFVRICRGMDHNRSPAEAGWRAVELLHAAYQSAAAGGTPVDVKDLYQE
jgi:predicted dehydrogenase